MSQIESLSRQLILAKVVWLILCGFIIESCIALFETSFLNCNTWILLEGKKQMFKLGVVMTPHIGLILGDTFIEIASSDAYFISISNANS